MADYNYDIYITSTGTTGSGTLRSCVNTLNSRGGGNICPSPTVFPSGTPCMPGVFSWDVTTSMRIHGNQTRIILDGSLVACLCELGPSTSSSTIPWVDFRDVDFRVYQTSPDSRNTYGAIVVQYCSEVVFTRCSFVGMDAKIAPIYGTDSYATKFTFNDCAIYGNRGGNTGCSFIYLSNSGCSIKFVNCTVGANVQRNSSSANPFNRSASFTNHVSSDNGSGWVTPPPSNYSWSTWTHSSWQSMNPRPSSTASWRTGAVATSSTTDIEGKARKTNGAQGAYEYYEKLSTPTNFTASNVTSSTVTLSWTAVTNATSYSVTVNGTTTTVSGTTATITGLAPLTTYQCQVIARNSNYLDSDSASTTATTLKPQLAMPANLHTSDITSTSATCHWNSVANAVDYRLEYREQGQTAWIDPDNVTPPISIESTDVEYGDGEIIIP